MTYRTAAELPLVAMVVEAELPGSVWVERAVPVAAVAWVVVVQVCSVLVQKAAAVPVRQAAAVWAALVESFLEQKVVGFLAVAVQVAQAVAEDEPPVWHSPRPSWP